MRYYNRILFVCTDDSTHNRIQSSTLRTIVHPLAFQLFISFVSSSCCVLGIYRVVYNLIGDNSHTFSSRVTYRVVVRFAKGAIAICFISTRIITTSAIYRAYVMRSYLYLRDNDQSSKAARLCNARSLQYRSVNIVEELLV